MELQHVNHLHVRKPKANLIRGLCIKEDGGGNEFADFDDDAVRSCDWGNAKNVLHRSPTVSGEKNLTTRHANVLVVE
jgi:hypothetical protein